MPANLTVPTIFTAVDRLSTVVSAMGRSVNGFANKASAGLARVNNKINSVIPGYNALKSALLGYVGAAVLAAAVIAGITFSVDSLVQYEKNVASLRIVLNDITQKEFKKYQDQIDAVAKSTRTSSVAVADAFAKIAELNIHLAATPQGLADVAKSAVIFARAANMEMAPAAEGLVSIMSQFGLGADQANRVINTLAAGLKHGSANIENQVEAYKNFGTVAKTANITLEQSTALVQTLAKYQLKGAEAGTALRGAIIRLQKAGAGYAHGQFNINDAIDQANKKYASLATARQKDAFLIKLFGIRQIIAGKLLLNNSAYTAELTKKVTGTNEAFVQADIRMNTVAGRLEQLKAGWVNYITTNDKSKKGMDRLKKAIVYVTDNLDKIIDRTFTFIKWFLILKGVILGARTALAIFAFVTSAANLELLIAIARITVYTGALLLNTIATGGVSVATGILTGAQWLLNEALAAGAASGWWGAISKIGVILGPIVVLIGILVSYIDRIKQNWEAVKKAFSDKGILSGLAVLGRALTAALVSPIQEFLMWVGKITGIDAITKYAKNSDGPVNSGEWNKWVVNPNWKEDETKPALMSPGTKAQQINSNSTTNNTLDINLNDPGKSVKSTNMRGPIPIPIKLGSTTGQN